MANSGGMTLLDATFMTRMIQRFKYSARKYQALVFFPRVKYEAGEITWDIAAGARGMAHIADMDGNGRIVPRDGVGQGRATPMHMPENTPMTAKEIALVRQPGSMKMETAQNAVRMQLQKLHARQVERTNWASLQLLQGGTVTYTHEQTSFTLDYSVTALTTPATLWNDASAKMIKNLADWIVEFTDAAGYPPTHLYYNPKLFSTYTLENTQWSEYVKASPELSTQVLVGSSEPYKVAETNLNWAPITGQYVNDAGSLVDRWPVNKISLGAPEEGGWHWAAEKTPRNNNTGNAFAHSKVGDGDDYGKVTLHTYDNGVPVAKDNNSVRIVTVA